MSSSNSSDTDFLTISFALKSLDDRNIIYVNYDLKEGSDGVISVYKTISDETRQFAVYLRDIDTSTQTSFKITINEEDLDSSGKFDFKLRVVFPNESQDDDCTIYWGDGEVYEEIYDGSNEGRSDLIHKGDTEYVYSHSYYSTGDFTIAIGNGLRTFMCGDDWTNTSDNSRSHVTECLRLSDSTSFTSAASSFMNCENLVGDIPDWGASITNASHTYYGCSKLSASTIPNWNDEMTDISECYSGCGKIGA